jgi:hypothetical protein
MKDKIWWLLHANLGRFLLSVCLMIIFLNLGTYVWSPFDYVGYVFGIYVILFTLRWLWAGIYNTIMRFIDWKKNKTN